MLVSATRRQQPRPVAAWRREAAQRGGETRRRKREQAAQGALEPEVAPRSPERSERPERNVAQEGRASGPMVTVALWGESAARLRALAASQNLSLAKLLPQTMDSLDPHSPYRAGRD
jgi:hypothetical protein